MSPGDGTHVFGYQLVYRIRDLYITLLVFLVVNLLALKHIYDLELSIASKYFGTASGKCENPYFYLIPLICLNHENKQNK